MLSRFSLYFLLFSIFSSSLPSQSHDLFYFIPQGDYDPAIPTPKEFLGHEVGEFHVTHDKLYYYVKKLSELSDRITLTEYARSHEKRPLVYLTITSPANHAKVEQLRIEHKKLTDTKVSESVQIDNMPIVIYQGNSIHGNEASGANGALAMCYYLAANRSDRIDELLDQSIILFDPSFNPDGLQRFSTWVNTHKGKNLISDNNSREYSEAWPGGRTNHYWFDLNRDWLLLTHPESRGRVNTFQMWKPDILTDHHEMGTNSTFYFMPGHPSRTNPNTPQLNYDLTEKIGGFHAKALDKIGSLYYTKEGFDDYYYGKGSTYPDAQGCIGILFEQASSRGHLQQSDNGLLSFPFAIRNQVTTMFSTQDAAVALRKEILEFKRQSFLETKELAKKNPIKAYVFGEPIDPYRTNRFIDILLRHHIEVHKLKADYKDTGLNLKKEEGYVVSLDQDQYRLAKTIFEKVREFQDSLFYDVSAWTMPLAFDIPYAEIKENSSGMLGERLSAAPNNSGQLISVSEPYAYVCEWHQSLAPRFLNQLLKLGVNVNLANDEFESAVSSGTKKFLRGSLIIPTGNNQTKSKEELNILVQKLAIENHITVYGVQGGGIVTGVNLGSRSHTKITDPKALMLIGDGVSSYDAGELWHHFDQVWDMAIPMVDLEDFGRLNLNDYNTIILPSGSYAGLNRHADNLKSWIQSGGNVIAIEGAIKWLQSKEFVKLEVQAATTSAAPNKSLNYSDAEAERGSRVTGGMIVNLDIDITHPLFYGYYRNHLAMFKQGNDYFKAQSDVYNTPGKYSSNPVMSGYIHKENAEKLPSSASVFKASLGRGKIICLVDNPVFRGYWWGAHKLLANSLFFGDSIF